MGCGAGTPAKPQDAPVDSKAEPAASQVSTVAKANEKSAEPQLAAKTDATTADNQPLEKSIGPGHTKADSIQGSAPDQQPTGVTVDVSHPTKVESSQGSAPDQPPADVSVDANAEPPPANAEAEVVVDERANVQLAIFKAADADKDGFISKAEFAEFMEKIGSMVPDDKMWERMCSMISCSPEQGMLMEGFCKVVLCAPIENLRLMLEMFEHANAEPSIEAATAADVSVAAEPADQVDELTKLKMSFGNALDLDNDGFVSYIEYCALMNSLEVPTSPNKFSNLCQKASSSDTTGIPATAFCDVCFPNKSLDKLQMMFTIFKDKPQ